jgi:hypothetical protein
MTGGAIALLVGMTTSAATTTGKVVRSDALTHAITVQTDAGQRFVFTTNDATEMDVTQAALPEHARVSVKTEESPTPAIPMLATGVRVAESKVATAPAAWESSVHSATKFPTVLPLIAALGALVLGAGFALGLRRRRA